MSKTVLKARYGSELRKNWIYHNNDVSLDDLITKMQRYFNIKEFDGIKLKYRDEEDDWITLTNDDDLSFALSTMEVLFVEVFSENVTTVKEEKSCISDEKVSAENTDTVQKKILTTKQMSIEQLTDIPLNNEDNMQHQPSYIGGASLLPPVLSNFGSLFTKGAESTTITNANVTAVSSAATAANNLATIADNFGNNLMATQLATFVPAPTATLQPFQYAQIQHAQQAFSHQQLPSHVISQSPSVQPQHHHTVQQATLHQPQHAAFQQQQYTGSGVLPPPMVSSVAPSGAGGFLPPTMVSSVAPSGAGGFLPPTMVSSVSPAGAGGFLPPPMVSSVPSGAGVLPPPPIGTHGTAVNPFSRQR